MLMQTVSTVTNELYWVTCVTICAVSVLSLRLAADASCQMYLAARAHALLP